MQPLRVESLDRIPSKREQFLREALVVVWLRLLLCQRLCLRFLAVSPSLVGTRPVAWYPVHQIRSASSSSSSPPVRGPLLPKSEFMCAG